jgi:lipopolysaccharide export LptBFGC system permease protein LptF
VATTGANGTISILSNNPKQRYVVRNVVQMETDAQPKISQKALSDTYKTYKLDKLEGLISAFDLSEFRPRGDGEQELTFPELIFGMQDAKFAFSQQHSNVELNYRLAQILFMLLLPFGGVLAVVEPRRNPGPTRYLFGFLFLLAFHQYLGLATSMARRNDLSLLAGIWVPFCLLATAILVLFWRLSNKPGFSIAR